jgi:hypothetical protein
LHMSQLVILLCLANKLDGCHLLMNCKHFYRNISSLVSHTSHRAAAHFARNKHQVCVEAWAGCQCTRHGLIRALQVLKAQVGFCVLMLCNSSSSSSAIILTLHAAAAFSQDCCLPGCLGRC